MENIDKLLGRRIGNYLLTQLLGRGGFAVVYLGEHIHLEGYLAAIKIFSPFEETGEEQSKELKEKFRTEAMRLAQLFHPNIVKVLDFGFIEDDTPYLVMENAPGGSLKSRYPKGSRLPQETILHNMQQAASGLQYLHENKLIHRDIKPANMLLGRNDTLLLSDIGIAVVAHREISYSPQEALGTPPYMAPEQWNENPCPASDQYSLGITLYEWLCGVRPFLGSKREHENIPPPSMLQKVPGLKPEIEAVVFKALAKNPEDRYPTIQAFAEAFERACSSQAKIEKGLNEQPDKANEPASIPSSLPVPPDIFPFEKPNQALPPIVPKAADVSIPFAPSPVVHEPLAPPLAQSGVNDPGSLSPGVDSKTNIAHAPRTGPGIIEFIYPRSINKLSMITPEEAAAASAAVPADPALIPALAPKPIKNNNTNKRREALAGGVLAAGALGTMAYNAAAQPQTPSGPPPGGGTSNERERDGSGRLRRRLIALLLLLLTVLLLLGIALISPLGQQLLAHVYSVPATATTVTITPISYDEAIPFTVSAVTGKPDPAQRQVQAAILSASTQSASASAHATGVIPGRQASGTLVFANIGNPVTIPGGTVISQSGVQIAFSTITVPYGSNSETGTAVSAGVSGDIPANNLNIRFSNGVVVKNPNPFSGGVDPINNAVITQTDITTATNSLMSMVKPQAQSQLKGKVKSNEDVVPNSLSCTASATANRKIGDVAPTVTVTGTATCSEEVYDRVAALQVVTSLLKAKISQKLGSNYLLAQNKIIAGITSVSIINAQNTVSLVVHTEGIWYYNFTSDYQQKIKNAIANQSEANALSYLKGQQGVADVAIAIPGGGTTLPVVRNITLIIKTINGPSATPTPTSTSQTGVGGS